MQFPMLSALLCFLCFCTQGSLAQRSSSSATASPTMGGTTSATPEATMLETRIPTPAPVETRPREIPQTPAPIPGPTPPPTLATTPAPKTPSPTPSPTPMPTFAPTLSPTISPTRFPGTFPPTPSPTFPYNSFCERPYDSNLTDVPCVEMVGVQDALNGAGAFYDETGCQFRGRSEVGCEHNGVQECRLCVFNRGLYSQVVLDGEEVPFVDCPCCVPELYGLGGDIDCDFPPTPVPTPAPGGPSTEAPDTPAPTTETNDGGGSNENTENTPTPTAVQATMAPTTPVISMEPCEEAAGGITASDSTLCVDLVTQPDLSAGIGYYYEEDCQGLGCNILGQQDCRQCLFSRSAYESSGQEGSENLPDCPCCVPLVYELRPADSNCIFPPTPTPTMSEEALASNGVLRMGGAGSATLMLSTMSFIFSALLAGLLVGW